MMLGNSSTTGSESVHSTLYDMTLSIKKKLAGSGGCGSVYVGIYGGKPIVAKVPTLNKHEELIHKELLVMKMLGPNDFTVQLVGYLDGVNILLPDDPNQIPRSALLLERMSLGTLSQYMKRRPNAKIRTEIYDLVFSERHAIALSASKGIEYIHKKNLVHLDIKAENILLNIVEKPTKKLIAKISDFGSTRRNGTTDSVFQTPGYVPPESKRSREKTFKYDSFAFGCVLIHMLTDDDPSVRPTSSEIVLKITELGASLFAILSSPAVLGSSVQDFPDTVLSVQPYTKNAKIRSRIESTGGYTAGHFIFESLEIKGATSPWNEFSQKFVTTFHSGNKFDADVLRTSVGPLANQVTLSRLNKKLFASIPPKNTENESGMWEEEVLEVVENLVQKCSTSPSATFVERPNMNSTNVSFLDPLLPPRPPMMPNSFDPPLPPRSPMSPLSMDSRPMSPNFNGSPMNSTYNGFNSSVRPGNLNFSNDLNVNNDFNFSNGIYLIYLMI
ncbi:kinase-like domain-containing protein [Globomyces pollinis-pini]|nr:kinase-like domain-containing protein [Globomyces pollinis-pini]